jgi:hypothetical protein
VTQNERILAILSDGDWHEKSEFYGFCVLHSRISELRHDHGKTIEKEHRGGKVFYRLVAPLEEREGRLTGAGADPLSSSVRGVDPVLPSRRAAPQQLSVFGGAA